MATSSMSKQIRRKPVPVYTGLDIQQAVVSPSSVINGGNRHFKDGEFVQSPNSIVTENLSTHGSSTHDVQQMSYQLDQLQVDDRAAVPPVPRTSSGNSIHRSPDLATHIEQDSSSPDLTQLNSSKPFPSAAGQALRSAYGEARHFAGGLIAHPSESTKHYSILRHSHGIVYYSGSYTNLAVSIFADQELPPARTFWLQRKGFSGKTGMAVGVLLRTHGSWIDVTPSVTATPDQVKPADERAWQRDIKKFLRKAPKKLTSHQIRETNVLRIPCDAEDGYLRVVMCAGDKDKKHLCSSPVFRLASTSMSSSSIRGASLMTLPIEAAIKVSTLAAQKTATTFAGPYIETARTLVTNQVASVYQPGFAVQAAATTAIDSVGVTGQLEKMNGQYDQARETSSQIHGHGVYDSMATPVLGEDTGPRHPYPVQFRGLVVRGTGTSMATLGVPTANVSNVDSEILLRYTGIYFGWAAVNFPQMLREEILVDDDWHKAIIYILPDPSSKANVVQKKIIQVYIIEDFEGAKFFDCKIFVMMMGFLHPAQQGTPGQDPEAEQTVLDLYHDIESTIASLARPAWQAEETLERVRSAASSRSITERYVDIRLSTQKQIDRVPTWRVGVRSDGAALKDRFIGNGGITIRR